MRFFFYQNSHKIFFYLFLLALLLQTIFWFKTEQIKPNYSIVPNPPNQYLVKAISLGDDEFLFRALAFRIQNSGDIFIKFVALKNYDYLKLYNWLKMLDGLNYQSNIMPHLAAYYFSQTQNKPDSAYMVQYLDEHASQNIDLKWWWMFQAINIAQENLNDDDLALKLSYKLTQNNAQNAPLWTKQMPAFIYAKRGKACMAFAIIQKLIDENNSQKRQITVEEMDFMRYFIGKRLKKLKDQNFDPAKCLYKSKNIL